MSDYDVDSKRTMFAEADTSPGNDLVEETRATNMSQTS